MTEGFGIGTGEDIIVNVKVHADAEQAKQTFEEVTQGVQQMGAAVQQGGTEWQAVGKEIRAATGGMQVATGPIRALSWDFMLMGRGMSILNTHLLGNVAWMKELTGIVYVFASVLRIATAAVDIYRVAIASKIVLHHLSTAAVAGEAGATWGLVQAKAALLSLSGPAGWVLLAGAGAAAAAYGLQTGLIKGFQQGGVVPETGVYALHKGETVIPAGTNFNQIFINMTTGPISSSIDVDNMLDNMALRMAKESRRRLGR